MKSTLRFAVLFLMASTCLSDFDNIQDFCPAISGDEKQEFFINGLPCKSPSATSPSDFKSSTLAQPGDTENFYSSATRIVAALDFPGLNTLGLSVARTDLDVDGLVMPHSHPRASEMFFIEKGSVLAGFIDTGNDVFQEVLGAGDVMVFPRGLLHFCFNIGFGPATAFSVLNSQNPGLLSISNAMFEAEHDVETLTKWVTSVVSLSKRGMLGNRSHHRNVTLIKFPNHFG